MTLYEINAAVAACVDAETGEVLDVDALDALQMAREEKLENLALWVKDLRAEADAIRAEEKTLAERRKVAENKAERLKKYLIDALGGEKFKSARCSVSYRRAERVNVTDLDKLAASRPDLVRNTPEANKTAIKAALTAGENVDGAELVVNTSAIIK